MGKRTTITIQVGQEYSTRTESIYDRSAFFYEAYQRAAEGIKEILLAKKGFEAQHLEKCRASDISAEKLSMWLLGYPNNVIAFCAERGQGKSSAMVSFSKALQSLSGADEVELRHKQGENYIEPIEFWKGSTATDYQYEVINYIDPTVLEDHDNILKIIISRMFNRFKERLEHFEKREPGIGRRENEFKLLELFQACHRDIELLKKPPTEFDLEGELDQIMALGDTSKLRGSMYKLVSLYLQIMTNSDKGMLVLQVDDADLSIQRTYEIMQHLRKFLFIPNVILLMAVNPHQLESTLEQHFIGEYQTSLSFKGMVDVDVCHNVAERYISKMIPGSRQINLPDLNLLLNFSYEDIRLHYHYQNDKGNNLLSRKSLHVEEMEDEQAWSFQEQLFRLLHLKTGMIFCNTEESRHLLLPRNLRELTHFLGYFVPMREVCVGYTHLVSGDEEANGQAVSLWKQNVERLQYYLLNVWAAMNLRDEERKFLQAFCYDAYEDKNLRLLKFLPEYYGYRMKSGGLVRGIATQEAYAYQEKFLAACRKNEVELGASDRPFERASYVDVCEVLNTLLEMPGSATFYKFVYAIRLCYSIFTHDLILSYWPGEEAYRRLADFLGDVLFKPTRVPYQSGKLSFGHFCINGGLLAQWIKYGHLLQNNDTEKTIATLCRIERQKKRSYVMESISNEIYYRSGSFSEKLEDKILHVDAFYPMFYDLNLLEGESKRKSESMLNVERTAGSLMTLMNWDVQNIVKENIYSLDEVSFGKWLYYFYRRIDDASADINYVRLPEKQDERYMFTQQEVFFAIQMSNPYFFLTYLEHLASEIKKEKVFLEEERAKENAKQNVLENYDYTRAIASNEIWRREKWPSQDFVQVVTPLSYFGMRPVEENIKNLSVRAVVNQLTKMINKLRTTFNNNYELSSNSCQLSATQKSSLQSVMNDLYGLYPTLQAYASFANKARLAHDDEGQELEDGDA